MHARERLARDSPADAATTARPPAPLPARVLELQRGAGNRAVAGLLQRAGTKKTGAQYNAIINVSGVALDQGSELLKKINRPTIVNDALGDKLSNCALATIAAIEGGRTSGEAAVEMRKQHGVTTHTTGDQSERVWAMTLADATTLKEHKLLAPADELRSKDTAKSLEDFAEGASYVVGDAQYYGMLDFLRVLAQTTGDASVKFKVFAVGEPGNKMFGEGDTLTKMGTFPNGTRYAVFLYSRDLKQHVRQHWVYAERFNGQVIFRDFQTNQAGFKGAAKEVANYIGGFPFSPEPQDKSKSFDEGCFIAFAPFFTGAPVPLIVEGEEIDPGTLAGTLAEVESKRRALSAPLESPGRKMPTNWPAMRQGGPLTEMPAPSVVDSTLRQLIKDLGVSSPACRFGKLDNPGVVKLVGNPVHGTSKARIVVGAGVDRQEVDVPSDQLSFPDVNATTNVVKPGQPAAPDANELTPGTAAKKEVNYREAFATAYQIAAQNTERSIILNASSAEFTDLIHEATHSFEATEGPMHFREGLAEIFASMATRRMAAADAGAARFTFAFNDTYAAFTAAMQELAAVVGLPPLARIYFATKEYKPALTAEIKRVAPGLADPASTAAKMLDDFPAGFRTGLSEISTAGATAEAATGGVTSEYAAHKTGFASFLAAQVAAYEKRYGKTLAHGADEVDKGRFVETWAGLGTLERRLEILYQHKPHVTGTQFSELMKLIDEHEKSICEATGESRAAMRKRMLPTSTVTFETHYGTKHGQNVFVCGEAPELGGWDPAKALTLNYRDGGVWEAAVQLSATGGPLLYKYFLKEGSTITWETPQRGEHHARTVPTASGGVRFKDNWGNVKGA
ncbi:MAG TPA: carbohydrate-binding module family 20 domain-containing protein [Solirubrobacteraceae bacterium]|nr:carbohydrate-binding module family 20 domain-containing protein [Solirubrobacteraceae bacterium]